MFMPISETKLSSSEKVVIGGTPSMAVMEIIEPVDKDKGVYSIQISDAEKTDTRTLDLSGDGMQTDYTFHPPIELHTYTR